MNEETMTGGVRGKAVAFAVVSGGLLLLAMFVSEVMSYRYIGLDATQQASISVSGDAEEYQAPDIAEISFSLVEEAKTVTEATKMVSEKKKAIVDFLIEKGIKKNDIKDTNYSFYPKYETVGPVVQCFVYPCPTPKQVLKGYEVNQSVSVKIRDIDSAGEIVGALGDKGATQMSNITFRVDEEDAVKAKARAAAIEEAKLKAKVLANQLGVSLVRIVSYSEGGDYAVYNYARSDSMKIMESAGASPEAVISPGENKFVSNVTITYEIK